MNIWKAKDLAKALMSKHGLVGWRFEFHNRKTALGTCNYRDKVIFLSEYCTPLLPDDIIKNTILHEIAHALVGPSHGHDSVWKMRARSIGCTGDTCADVGVLLADHAPFKAECECGYKEPKFKRPIGGTATHQCKPWKTGKVIFYDNYTGKAL